MTGATACVLSALALVDPRLRGCVWVAVALALFALARDRPRRFAPLLALALGLLGGTGFSLGADSLNYFAYTSTILVDQDLDLRNQWERLGFGISSLTTTGLVPNPMSVGPGMVWMPAVVLTHLWLSSTGGAVDSLLLAPSYYAAAAATTVAVVLGGAWLLTRSLAVRFGAHASALALAVVVLASPIVYYTWVQPLMSHGLTFGFAAASLALVMRAERSRHLGWWAACGASVGLAMLCRAQALPLLVFVAAGLWRARAGWRNALAAGAAVVVSFSPQLVTWQILYGSFVTIPQGDNFVDWSGRHSLDALLSADRGLFNWHPVLALGLVGLLSSMKGLGAYAVASVSIFAFTAFLNGSVLDWNASAAFGGRRFDVVLPLLAVGLAALLCRARLVLMQKPLLLPAALVALAILWNLSLIELLRGRPASALPLDERASLQSGQARRAADATFGVLGPRARDLIFRIFVGQWTYENYRPGGDFDLATLEPRFVREGWSSVQGWDDGTLFRYLLFPRGCLVIPLDRPFDLRGFALARSPARIAGQRLTLSLNGVTLTQATLPAAWTEIPFTAPSAYWKSGENEFCMTATERRPGDEGDDLAYAAAVVRVQLP